MFYRPQGLFDQLSALHQALTRSLAGDGMPDAIRSVAAGAYPGINVGRTAKSLEIYAFAPGIDAASIDVTVERGVLKISGERHAPKQSSDAKVQAYASERPQGRFSRAITLPDDVDTSKVEAKYRDGVLHISIAVSEAAQPQRIPVQ
ncbi:MAG: Hsp20/alpha crystallin family protein [Piscinibacter sp.]|nr:Hsp20/alpha crystallin family protein [Piscinibacter sp.]